MKIYLPGGLIREIRSRKGLRQGYINGLSPDNLYSKATISRVENLQQDPSQSTIAGLLAGVNTPYERFFCPYMEEQTAETYVLRHQIAYLLERAEGAQKIQAAAKTLIDELKNKLDFDSLLNKQLWISLKTKLDVIRGSSDAETLALINEGLKLTYPEFDEETFDGNLLIFSESELVISLARYYANNRDLRRATRLLYRARDGCMKLPVAEQFKDRLLGKICVLLTSFLLKKGDYNAALEVSEEGLRFANKDPYNSQLPSAVYMRARALIAKKNKKEGLALLIQAYFAFALCKKEKNHILKYARNVLSADFEAYGTENIKFELPEGFFNVKYGGSFAVGGFGTLMRQFRLAAGLKPAEIYEGICSRSFYSKIENGERRNASIFILEALMQRLGRDIGIYFNYFPSIKEFREVQLRKLYQNQLYIGNIEQAESVLSELMKIADYSKGLRTQFLLYCKAIRIMATEGAAEACLRLLVDALKVTVLNFSEENISFLRLTNDEVQILNGIGWFYGENGDIKRAVSILTQIKESMRNSYVDESAKADLYSFILYNLADYHEKLGQHELALERANECEGICERQDYFFRLNELAEIKARILFSLGRKEESAAYAAMAYFSGSLTVSEHDLDLAGNFAKEKLGIEFSRDLGFVFYKEKGDTY